MRLTHLKLAGFKSFVDSTTLHIHGQRVGIVGPNGCGKSNVMESVRWVLGESSAKELRGENMDAVIFNGSGNRKPISRASAELVFDNSMGSAAGEWSQYAEISVKRVIEREKGSTYYINNTVVRKRDVADLFLGTGLGGRAYAIIGQNTINRIVEAKPEEMRVFLEEAAGISKYKDRRRETELRLRDTRDNLTRVEDILNELQKQIERLTSQAEVAGRFGDMQTLLDETKGQIWLLKKEQAHDKWQKSQRQVEQLVNDLEAQVTSLRQNENALETARQAHIDSTDAMNIAQTQYYEVNAEVSGLESQIKSAQDSNSRMQIQLQQYATQGERNISQRKEIQASIIEAQHKLENTEQSFADTAQEIAEAKAEFSERSEIFQATLTAFESSVTTLNTAEQSLKIEQSSIQHLRKSLTEVEAQLTRLNQQVQQIEMPEDSVITDLELQAEEGREQALALEESASEMQAKELAIDDKLRAKREQQQGLLKNLHTLEAEMASIAKLQSSIHTGGHEGDLSQWLKRTNLESKQRIWQKIRMQKGWEVALEAALSGRLNAIVNADIVFNERAPNALTVVKTDAQAKPFNKGDHADQKSIFSVIESIEVEVSTVMQNWLSGVYIADDADEAVKLINSLNTGELVVTRDGDIYTEHSVTYFGPQSELHGVLEREAELERLTLDVPTARASVDIIQKELEKLEVDLEAIRSSVKSVNQSLRTLNQTSHQTTLKLQQHKQQQQNAIARKSSMEQDIVAATEKQATLNEELAIQEEKIANIGDEVNALSEVKQSTAARKNEAELARNTSSNTLQDLEKSHQEKSFSLKLTNNTIKELNDKLAYLNEESLTVEARQEELNAALALTSLTSLMQGLEAMLDKKQTFEEALAQARNGHSDSESALQALERERMENDQQLHPLRDKLEASRLADQEARLYYEQCVEELTDVAINEASLVAQLASLNEGRANNPHTVKELNLKKDKLTRQIDGLGAVNLAAVEELNAETTRHALITQQSEDLTEASDTLENAIKKIDKETRGRLQATYEEANRHFGELFSTLFNGGQARLELLGDEILDTGIQVFAQPPGKKNSTIHLLSGGEKAMTAIALVFALFRLNPAPFCLMDEVDAPLDDSNTERFCAMVKKMSEKTQFMYVSHNKITMEMAQQLIGVTMQESGVSRIVDVDMDEAAKMVEAHSA